MSRKYIFTGSVFVMLWLSLAAWALSSPIGASPDEDFHQTMIYCYGKSGSKCLEKGERYGHCFSMRPTLSANCSKYKELSEPIANQIGSTHYPPLYYKFMSLFVGKDLAETTINVRLANVTLTTLLVFFSIFLSCILYRPAVTLSWIVVSMPTGLYFLTSLNPSSWILLSLGSIWGPLLSLFSNDLNSKDNKNYNYRILIFIFRISFIVFAATIGFGSRGEAIIWLPLLALILLIYLFPTNQKLISKKIFIRSSVIVVTLSIIIYSILDQYGSQKISQFLSVSNSFTSAVKNYFNIVDWLMIQQVFNVLFGVTGLPGVPGSGLGTHDVPVPAIAIIFIGYALSACLLLGLTSLSVRKVITVGSLAILIVIFTSFLWSLQNWEYLQGRYFLPILYPLFGFLLISNDYRNHLNKWQLTSLLSAMALANCLILLSILLRFMYGVVFQQTRYPLTKNAPDINPSKLFVDDIPSWWWTNFPLSPSDLWILGSICYAFLMLLVWKWLKNNYFT